MKARESPPSPPPPCHARPLLPTLPSSLLPPRSLGLVPLPLPARRPLPTARIVLVPIPSCSAANPFRLYLPRRPAIRPCALTPAVLRRAERGASRHGDGKGRGGAREGGSHGGSGGRGSAGGGWRGAAAAAEEDEEEEFLSVGSGEDAHSLGATPKGALLLPLACRPCSLPPLVRTIAHRLSIATARRPSSPPSLSPAALATPLAAKLPHELPPVQELDEETEAGGQATAHPRPLLRPTRPPSPPPPPASSQLTPTIAPLASTPASASSACALPAVLPPAAVLPGNAASEGAVAAMVGCEADGSAALPACRSRCWATTHLLTVVPFHPLLLLLLLLLQSTAMTTTLNHFYLQPLMFPPQPAALTKPAASISEPVVPADAAAPPDLSTLPSSTGAHTAPSAASSLPSLHPHQNPPLLPLPLHLLILLLHPRHPRPPPRARPPSAPPAHRLVSFLRRPSSPGRHAPPRRSCSDASASTARRAARPPAVFHAEGGGAERKGADKGQQRVLPPCRTRSLPQPLAGQLPRLSPSEYAAHLEAEATAAAASSVGQGGSDCGLVAGRGWGVVCAGGPGGQPQLHALLDARGALVLPLTACERAAHPVAPYVVTAGGAAAHVGSALSAREGGGTGFGVAAVPRHHIQVSPAPRAGGAAGPAYPHPSFGIPLTHSLHAHVAHPLQPHSSPPSLVPWSGHPPGAHAAGEAEPHAHEAVEAPPAVAQGGPRGGRERGALCADLHRFLPLCSAQHAAAAAGAPVVVQCGESWCRGEWRGGRGCERQGEAAVKAEEGTAEGGSDGSSGAGDESASLLVHPCQMFFRVTLSDPPALLLTLRVSSGACVTLGPDYLEVDVDLHRVPDDRRHPAAGACCGAAHPPCGHRHRLPGDCHVLPASSHMPPSTPCQATALPGDCPALAALCHSPSPRMCPSSSLTPCLCTPLASHASQPGAPSTGRGVRAPWQGNNEWEVPEPWWRVPGWATSMLTSSPPAPHALTPAVPCWLR
ncbi:unnamed protein product [Closterium sp. Naga37s-1]|nr:unnamed protein product [Closterium sp. Naga37s-1]